MAVILIKAYMQLALAISVTVDTGKTSVVVKSELPTEAVIVDPRVDVQENLIAHPID